MRPPLLFIHGFWTTPALWSWFGERYLALGHEVRAVHLPDHQTPLTEPPPAAVAGRRLQDYLAAVLDQLPLFQTPPVLVGHSAGGLLALMAASRARVAGLVLLAPAATASTAGVPLASARVLLPGIARWGWWREPVGLDPRSVRRGVTNGLPADEAARVQSGLVWESGRALAQVALPWLDGTSASSVDLAGIRVPVLSFVGSEDRLTPVAAVRRIVRRLGGGTDYVELPGIGHWLVGEAPRATVAERMDAFLGELEAPPAGI